MTIAVQYAFQFILFPGFTESCFLLNFVLGCWYMPAYTNAAERIMLFIFYFREMIK